MKKEDTIHIVFRVKETGRYAFHAKWPKEEFDKIEKAALLAGVSVEEFILEAIEQYVKVRKS